MMAYYKPKIFRNSNGCCICRTKSSSSRFTDSIKYEPYFENCFRLMEKRTGDICNACVLVIKRWKKLPDDTDRHWNHVVDARAKPGLKSMNKYKSKPSPSLASEDLASISTLTIKDENSTTTQKYESKLKRSRRITSIPLRRFDLEDLASMSTLTIKDEFSRMTNKYKSKLKLNCRVTSVPCQRLALEDLASTSTVTIKDEFSPTTNKSKPSPSLASEDLASTPAATINEEFSLATCYDSLYQSFLISRQRSDSHASNDNENGASRMELSELEINACIVLTHLKNTRFKEE